MLTRYTISCLKLVLPEGIAPSPQGSKPCMLICYTTGAWYPRLDLHQRPSPSQGDALCSCATGIKLVRHAGAAPARAAWKAVMRADTSMAREWWLDPVSLRALPGFNGALSLD